MHRKLLGSLLLAGLLLSSCKSPQTPPARERTPFDIEVAFDPTPPNADQRARIAAATLPSIAEGCSGFTLRATDNKASIVATATPEDEGATYKILNGIIHRMLPVTDLAGYFEAIAADYKRAKKKFMIVVYTDGLDDGDWKTVKDRIKKAAADLAANPNFQGVLLVGLVREIRPYWIGLPEMLAPLGGPNGKLHIIPQADMNPERVQSEFEAIKTAARVP